MSYRFCAVVFLLLSSCASYKRMTIDPPPPADAPLSARLEAHDRLRKKQEDVSYQEPISSQTNKLRDAGFIHHPGDLSVAVLPDSNTSQSIRVFEDKVGTQATLETTSMVLISVGGVILVGGGALTAAQMAKDGAASSSSIGLIPVLVGIGSLVTGIVVQQFSSGMNNEIHAARNAALDTYDDDLLQRLNLCKLPVEKGITVSACP
jgi:hypothetical protein